MVFLALTPRMLSIARPISLAAAGPVQTNTFACWCMTFSFNSSATPGIFILSYTRTLSALLGTMKNMSMRLYDDASTKISVTSATSPRWSPTNNEMPFFRDGRVFPAATISRAMEIIARRGLPVSAEAGTSTVAMFGDEKPKVQAPLTSGFARTAYELETIAAREQKLSYGKAEAENKAELAPANAAPAGAK